MFIYDDNDASWAPHSKKSKKMLWKEVSLCKDSGEQSELLPVAVVEQV